MIKKCAGWGTALLILGVLLLNRPGLLNASEGSSCVTCHQGVKHGTSVEHSFADWKKSIHAQAGVSCDACHGGQPTMTEKKKAHKGLLPSTHRKSPVYFTEVPETCGSCHEAESGVFQDSRHGRALERTGRGPNCVTCHGSMANRVIGPRELENTCNLCHRKPTRASAALLALNNASSTVEQVRKAVDGMTKKIEKQHIRREAYLPLEESLREIQIDWHSFAMDSVLRRSQILTRRAKDALNLIKIKEMQ